jgi:hypothetical protein
MEGHRFGRLSRIAALAGAFGLLSIFASDPGHAVPIPFDRVSGNPTVVATVSGTGGTMTFTLDVNDPGLTDRSGNFSMDIFNSGNVLLGSISLAGAPFIDGPFASFGSIEGGVLGGLSNVSTWSLAVGAPGFPLTLVVTSALFDALENAFNPLLSVDTSGDLVVAANAVPLPGALPLFAAGLALMGVLRWRRSRDRGRSENSK